MRPYYERDGIVIYHADCRDVLPSLGRESVELLVTDPPYGIGWKSNYGQNFDAIVGDDGTLDVPAALGLAAAVLQRRRHAYVFGRFNLLPPLTSAVELVWDKANMGGGDVTSVWGPAHEPIMFAVRSVDKGKVNMARGGVPARLRQGSVLRYLRPNGNYVNRHPTEKPVALLRRLVESSSFPGEVALDPFLGSGSTLVAAILEGRKGVGIEIEERYCEIAANRCDVALVAYRTLMEAAA